MFYVLKLTAVSACARDTIFSTHIAELVVRELKLQSDKDQSELSDVRHQLSQLKQQVKDIAMTTKKSSSTAQSHEDT